MKKILWLIVLIIIVVVAYIWLRGGNDETVTPPASGSMEKATFTLAELNDSGVSGTATLSYEDVDGGPLTVVVDLVGTPEGGSHPAHIHENACADIAEVKHGLLNVEDGTSTTVLQDVSFNDITAGLPLSINVHLSDADLGSYVACGNIEVGEAMAK